MNKYNAKGGKPVLTVFLLGELWSYVQALSSHHQHLAAAPRKVHKNKFGLSEGKLRLASRTWK